MRLLARRFGIRPSKTRGQNFLIDPNTARRVVRLSGVGGGDRVLEVGAGLGSLTVALAGEAGRVIAVEVDDACLLALREVTADLGNVTVVGADALTIDYGELLEGEPSKMVSNLPYSIATHLVARLLEEVEQLTELTFMVQREVAERLVAPPGSRTYGAVSVLVAYRCAADVVGNVPPTVFWPRPKVASAIVRMVRRPPPVDVPPDRLMKVVHAAFSQRRKMLRNSLASGLGRDPQEIEEAIERAGLDPRARAERLSLAEFARLSEAL